MEQRKLIVVTDSGPLEELGGIGGPILTPTRITLSAIRRMVTNGRTVYECYPAEPRNKEKWVQLDFANISTDNFAPEQSEEATPPAEAPAPVKKPETNPTISDNTTTNDPVAAEVPDSTDNSVDDDKDAAETDNISDIVPEQSEEATPPANPTATTDGQSWKQQHNKGKNKHSKH